MIKCPGVRLNFQLMGNDNIFLLIQALSSCFLTSWWSYNTQNYIFYLKIFLSFIIAVCNTFLNSSHF